MKTTAPAESKPRHLNDDREYAEALEKLERLDAAQKAAIANQGKLEMQMNRDEQARRQVGRGMVAFGRGTSDEDLDGFASRVATEGCVSESLMAEMRRGARVYGADDFNGNGALMSEFDNTRRCRQIVDRALVFQKKEVKRLKAIASKAINESVRGDRERIARAEVDCVLALGLAVREEHALAASMGMDEGFSQDVRPRPFPVDLPWEQLLIPWLGEILGISEAEARSKAGLPSLDIERRRRDLDRAAGARG